MEPNRRPIDFDALKADLLARARTVLPMWLTGGRFNGREFVAGNLAGEAGHSLSINIDTGKWADFADGARGGDLISLYAAIRGLSQIDAARALIAEGYAGEAPSTGQRRPAPQQQEEATIGMPPADAPAPNMHHSRWGDPSRSWTYRASDGTIIGHIARYDPQGERKQIVPWSWDIARRCWRALSFPAPRPLYRLDLLATSPDTPVMLVEGEKAADAAQEVVGTRYVVMTWPGGSKAIGKVDWQPVHGRRLILWPDADEPGLEAMRRIGDQLGRGACPEIKMLDVSGQPDGWDAADALAEGWNWDRLFEWAKQRATVYQSRPPQPTTPPPRHQTSSSAAGGSGPSSTSVPHIADMTDGAIALGSVNPDSGRIVLSASRTLPTGASFLKTFYDHAAGRTLQYYAGLLMAWQDNRYAEIEDGAANAQILPWLHEAERWSKMAERYEAFPACPKNVKAALDTVKALTHLPAATTPPCWLDGRQDPPANEMLACRSALIHLPTMSRMEPTPQFFNVAAIDYDHHPDAPQPVTWLKFLEELLGDDLQAWDLLQEWAGYCLTCDTSQQKMLMLVGPKRSGKGTLARILTRVIGAANVVGPTTGSLAGHFGLQPLIGKSLAIVSDARFHGENVQTVVERLLCISGEDAVTIDRKHQSSVTLRLPTRFMFLTNELPRLTDASGALAGRFMMVQLTRSFYGQENTKLEQALIAELPGILNWAIEGWMRLRQRGHFIMPASSEDAIREMEDLASPVLAFVRDICVVDAAANIECGRLFEAWKTWCGSQGRDVVGTAQRFGRDLRAAVPGLKTSRPTLEGSRIRFYAGIDLRPDQYQQPGQHDQMF